MLQPFIKSGKKDFISVWLDESQDSKIKDFHCNVCGKIVFQYYKRVKMLIPGEPGVHKAPIVIQCSGVISTYEGYNKVNSRCKQKYFIT